jgi:FAD/FMN-containing dehydrogenase
MVDGRGFSDLRGVDRDAGTITVGGGMTLRTLGTILSTHDLRLPGLGTSWYPTVAGALATAMHGSSTMHGTLSDSDTILGMTLLTADGELLFLDSSREADNELLGAARVHLGALGLVVDITFKTRPGAKIELETSRVKVEELTDPSFHHELAKRRGVVGTVYRVGHADTNASRDIR